MASETSKDNILERVLHDPSAEPTNLPLSLLEDITNNFSEDQKIGTGGFAHVYKGSLRNGTMGTVAVKKLSKLFVVDDKTFYQEVHSLMKVKHKNIVRFLGYCANTEEKFCTYEGKNVMADIRQKLLCFEFMPKGSLDQYITNACQGLEWKTRYQIIKGICEGLHYLHNMSILHLDLKPANILLNDYMEPKIADFGLSRCFEEKQSKIITLKPSGSVGYMAPERFGGVITRKLDIYSLGVIILEILTGQRGHADVDDVLECWKTRFKASQGDTWLEHVRVCTEIGIKCIDSNPKRRPETQHIIKTLDETERTYGFIETDCCTSLATHGVTPISLNPKELEAEEKQKKLLNKKQQENQDLLIQCVSQNLGFSSGKPIAACLIYRCLQYWGSFEVERTRVFDHIVWTIRSDIEYQENNDKLAYWLSNSSTLLLLLQRTLKTTGAVGLTPERHRLSAASFIGRAFVAIKFPALIFKQQLTDFLEKIYRMIRDNLKEEVSPLLGLCIQEPRTYRASLNKGSCSQANALAQQTLTAHWQNIVEVLIEYLNVLKANYVPSFLISKVFTQLFSFINVKMFNSLVLGREHCSLSNGEYVKAGLAELEQWCIDATEEYAGSSWDELKHIRQAVGFLVIREKPMKTLKEITSNLCPVLGIEQLYQICKMYWDDKYGTHTFSSDVISSMKVMMTEDSNNGVSSSFLLNDDDSSIPFSVDDILKSMAEVQVADVDMPPFILENSGFAFLLKRED